MASSLETMDEELRDASLSGDVEFLRKCVESKKPIEYYMSYCPQSSDKKDYRRGNILHIAAYYNREEFIREAIQILPPENIQNLLLQPREPFNANPLHVVAQFGNIEIVKMFLDVYRCLPTLPSDLSKRPWLRKQNQGLTACYMAILVNHEECALELLKMDTELICNMPDERGSYLLYDAMLNKLTKLSLEIVRSPHSIRCTGPNGLTSFNAIQYLDYLEGAEEIFRRLLQREPGLIEQRDYLGLSVFFYWGNDGKMWPFECLLKCHDIIPDVKRVFANLVSSANIYDDNPLHCMAFFASNEEVAIEIAKLMIDVYKQESLSISEDVLPWLVQDNDKDTPLSLAIERKYEKFALYILSVDENAVIKNQKNVLFFAIEKGCHQVAEKILEVIEKQRWTHLLYIDKKNVLHLAPLCKKEFCAWLIEGHPELLKGIDKGGITILHNWVKNGEVWLFEYILESKWRSTFVKLLYSADYNNWNNPFHIAATSTTNEAINQIVKLLVDAYKEDFPYWKNTTDVHVLPWFRKNRADKGPLHLAILNQHEELALYLLSLHEKHFINELLDFYEPEYSILFLAIQHNCPKVAKVIMSRLDKESWTKYLKDPSDGRNILHLATLRNEMFGTWLVNEAPEFITEKDNNGQSAWDKAYELGPAWFVKAVLEKDSSVFSSEPLAWKKACEHGHVAALRAFIDHNPGAFRDLCIDIKDSPLNHIKLSSLTEYEEFLKIQHMKDLINLQNSVGETSLHKAIRKGDRFLTETLLKVDNIAYNLIDSEGVTAMDLLAQVSEDNEAWDLMCKRHGLDPKIKTTYFRHKTNLIDVRSSLFVVGALLATITFTAGFTLPGGFAQDTGEALLGKKTSFLVFLVSDALALFSSMLVLICLTWSMVFEHSKSIILIDRSMVLLRISLNCTLLAFVTGVYIVIAAKSLWVAILIIVIISSLIIISINKDVLYNIMDKLFPASNKECKDALRLVELGYKTREEMDLMRTQSRHDSNQSGSASNHSTILSSIYHKISDFRFRFKRE